ALAELAPRYDTYGIYHRHPIALPKTQTSAIDLTEASQLRAYLRELKPNWIFHSAALVNVDECEAQREKAYRTNVVATRNLANYASENNVKLIFISTDAFFNGPENRTFTESDTPTPVNYYGET